MNNETQANEELKSWTKKHYHAFTLVWAAYSDLECSAEEKNYIKMQVGGEEYRWAEGKFANYNDIECIELLRLGRQQFYPTERDKTKLESDIRTLFSADHEWSQLEDIVLKALQRIL